jgi:hypothetical protein
MLKHIAHSIIQSVPSGRNSKVYMSKCGIAIRSRDTGNHSDKDLCKTCARLDRYTKKKRVYKPLKKREGQIHYKLGNFLRGFFEGYFFTEERAWEYLSHRFNLSYPSETGRHVYMEAFAPNAFGFEEFQICKKGITSQKVMNYATTLKLARKA